MTPVIIENPVINSPFEEPKRHFRFSDEGITNEIMGTRRGLWLAYRAPHSGYNGWAGQNVTFKEE
jgi:hypothetical protein